jgi:hypothetical protein
MRFYCVRERKDLRPIDRDASACEEVEQRTGHFGQRVRRRVVEERRARQEQRASAAKL